MKKFLILFCFLFALAFDAQSQEFPPADWYHYATDHPVYPGISTNIAYEKYLKNSKSKPIVVAVLDTGVDIEHEDLKANIWVNEDEIPGNGVDDDGNGYIDDIHGWNFIGNPAGENVQYDSYEVTRLYAKLRYQYEEADPDNLDENEKEEYELYIKCKKEVESKRAQASEYLLQLEGAENYLLKMVNRVKVALNGQELTIENLDSVQALNDQELFAAVAFMRTLHKENGFLPSISDLEEAIENQFTFQMKELEKDLEYSYNPDFNSRLIIGDDYSDPSQRYYGNNDVKSEISTHGTHVAGIIAAQRNNDLGIDGIAEHVKIMSVRMLPDGDEHDKDVANAIRYAVENGAAVINMSFGKYYEWDKEIVDEAVKFAEDHDVLIVHAAGNEAFNNNELEHFPTRRYKSPGGFLWFRNKIADNWIEVGALSWQKDEDLVASFSNYGSEEVDIFAPGVFITSTVDGNEYNTFQGTSMAAPIVTGVAAVIRSYFPALTAEQVRDVILKSSSPVDFQVFKPGSRELVGFGELAQSGGIVNLESCILLAAQTEGKKKIKKEDPENIEHQIAGSSR